MLDAPDAEDDESASGEHDEERERADSGREAEAERQADVHDREHDRGVEQLAVPLRPRFEVSLFSRQRRKRKNAIARKNAI